MEQQAKEVLLNNIESLYACGGNIQDKISNLIKNALNRILLAVFMRLDYIFLPLWLVGSLGLEPSLFAFAVGSFVFVLHMDAGNFSCVPLSSDIGTRP